MNELSHYIEQQRQAGTVESAGSFTLAIEKARDKLGSYSFAQPEDYILKLVQCAVLSKVRHLFIELQRASVLLYFEVEEANHSFSVESLTQALLSPLEEADQARSHLALALCALAARGPVELMWGDWGAQSATVLSLGHGRSELFRDLPFPRTEPLSPGRRLHLLYLVKQPSGLPLSQTAAEGRAVRERCCFAPLTIHLNGRTLTPSLPTHVSSSDPVRQLTGLYFGALLVESREEERGALRWPASVEGIKLFQTRLPYPLERVVGGLPPVFSLELPEHLQPPLDQEFEFSSLFGVPAFLYGPSLIHYVKDGVMLDPVLVHDAGGGAFAILDGEARKTDLTGLQVVRDETVESETRDAVDTWKRLVNGFVDGAPPVLQDGLLARAEDTVDRLVRMLMVGPLDRFARPLYEYFTGKHRRRALLLKKFQRQLETRRRYLAYFRDRGE